MSIETRHRMSLYAALDEAEESLRIWDRYDPMPSSCKALEQGQRCVEALRQLLELMPDNLTDPYNELLMAVSRKFDGETQHQTALRYIRERDSDGTATAAANGDLPVPQDCQARAESIAPIVPPIGSEHP